jgi:hypothetical protein
MPFLLMIRERRYSWAGRDPMAVIHPTREAAQAQLLDYVRENWDDQMGDEPPEDEDELVEQYFDCVHEEYVITGTAFTTLTETSAAQGL